jgi:D-3-phosphoglycerate dehydrogenase / 2-oxoglutarate reductase
MKILCTAPVKGFNRTVDFLQANAETTFMDYPNYEEVFSVIDQYDGFMPNARMKIDGPLLDKADKLKVIYQPSLGRDHIDEKSCVAKSITIFGLSDDKEFQATLWSTAEYTVGLILLILKRYRESSNSVTESGKWRNIEFIGTDIKSKTLGIVGYGNIGKKVDALFRPFGVHTLKCDPYIKQLDESFVDLEEIFSLSDIISIHVPLTEETKGMISKKYLSKMNGGYIVNASRGPVIVDEDLIEAMKTGWLRSAALDVLNNESPHGVQGHPLVEYSKINPRLTITPHTGGSSYEYLDSIFLHSAQRLIKLLNLVS